MPFCSSVLYSHLQRSILCSFLATMAWVVGMADDENKDGKASGGKKRKKQKPSKCELCTKLILCYNVQFRI